MADLKSSNLNSATYDLLTRTLTINFKGGARYNYADVDQATYDGLMTADSPGRYFAQNIKDKFSFTKG